MNPQVLIRKKSLSSGQCKAENDFHSPYLKPPLSTKNSVLPQLRSKRKIKTFSFNQGSLIRSPLKSKEIHMAGSVSPSVKFHSDSEFLSDAELSENSDPLSENLLHHLQENLKLSKEEDFKSIFQIYLNSFNELLSKSPPFSKLLEILKNGLINSLKKRYKLKLSKAKEKGLKDKNLIETLSREKENFIGKLNVLSSQNIDLLTSNEIIIEKYKKFQETLDHDNLLQRKRGSLLDEITTKNEKIKELSEKLEEMYSHENKLLQIIEKFNINGLDIQNLYHETAVRPCLFDKKRKKQVPSINLTFLDSE